MVEITSIEILRDYRIKFEELGFVFLNNNYTFTRTKNSKNDVIEFSLTFISWQRFCNNITEINKLYSPNVFIEAFNEYFCNELRLLKIKKIRDANS